MTAGGYASFDNLLIVAAQQEGEVPGTVPEPASLLLLGAGLAAAAAKSRKRGGFR